MQNKITTIFFDLFGVLLGVDQSVVVQYISKLVESPYFEVREIAMGEPFMRLERSEINFDQYVDKIGSELRTGCPVAPCPLYCEEKYSRSNQKQ